jgi:uncharacterized LabA/DUF88 family protein
LAVRLHKRGGEREGRGSALAFTNPPPCGGPAGGFMKVLVFIDLSNVSGQLRPLGRKEDLLSLRSLVANEDEGRYLVDCFVYARLPHTNGDAVHRWHDWLRAQGFQVVSKRAKKLPNGAYKCNLDGELMLDALDLGTEIRPDVVVLVTGDGDMAPLALRLRRKGIRVEVASLGESLAAELRLASQGFIDLTEWANACERVNDAAPELGGANIFHQAL